ncbi:mediator of RNA polymerase II transcription subunit 7 [Kluyveromyces marxianus]|uniref:Mediator of RNA polymerase II transcription subunit 7 n=2 Tax=Kluyveromyces marxianus TaxID=4911 RepID=W0TG16_KLUMD|nr:mediator of RNA polymerase II transcription subunit 7 [Kluyveromyces marxianus DMKU3-1042]QGN18141.1 mediator of RNA polymerase II transcription subunit 7 [Kluyveromyces marxianus]BAO42008.1 mediator of RNA polymerase II transcription subunit 7 [Kluyveromyces marxianus DMKU3-1042]BAP73427.1 mediator of RNA polymerase II transcription subunit 7 [Kluyveromyces marxianus]
MSDKNEISALYPPPPPFIQFFTEENAVLHSKCQADKAVAESLTARQLEQLKYFEKPELPKDGTYRAFGNVWQINDKLPELSQMGIEQLYKKHSSASGSASGSGSASESADDSPQSGANYENKIQELKKLLKSLLLNFLELIGLLGVDSSMYDKKLNEIRVIAINIHHLLNEYRPHQSRESLIMLLEEQLEHKRREMEQINKTCDEVEAKLAEL